MSRSISAGSNIAPKRDIRNGTKSSWKSWLNPTKVLSKVIIQPLTYPVRKGSKLFGKRVSIKHKNYGSVRSDTKTRLIRQRDAVDASESSVGFEIVDTRTLGSDRFATMDGGNITNQRLSSFRSKGDDQNLSRRENDRKIVVSNLDESHHSIYETTVQEQIVFNLERILRFILSLMGVYLSGVYQPFTFIKVDVLILVGQAISVAWCTCLFIQLISWWMSDINVDDYEESSAMQKGEESLSQKISTRSISEPNLLKIVPQPNLLETVPVESVKIKSQKRRESRR